MDIDLADTVFLCIDIQPREPRSWTAENILPEYKEEGFSIGELNDAETHFQEVLVPNAVRLARWARAKGLPRVFVHWSEGRPHDRFETFPEDRVVPKTEMDAFPSSDIAQALKQIGRRTLLMIGGHTQGCLGRTAVSALAAGYRCVLVRDASYDCSIKRWPKGIAAVDYNAILETENVLKL